MINGGPSSACLHAKNDMIMKCIRCLKAQPQVSIHESFDYLSSGSPTFVDPVHGRGRQSVEQISISPLECLLWLALSGRYFVIDLFMGFRFDQNRDC